MNDLVQSKGRKGSAARIGLGAFGIALGVQCAIWLAVASLEFIGLSQMQRGVLRSAETFYEPAVYVLRWFTPSDWYFLGNVMLGFLAVAWGVIAYSFLIGCGAALLTLCRHRTSKVPNAANESDQRKE